MHALIWKIYRHVLILRIQIKLMKQKQFDDFVKDLDFEQKVYAIFFRLFWDLTGESMDGASYNKIQRLLCRIDNLSSSYKTVDEMLTCIRRDGGTEKLYIHSAKDECKIDLTEEITQNVLQQVLDRYSTGIKKAKNEMNKIVDSTIGG